ncbi:MAG: recombination protein NinG [Rectinema sp.]
MRRALPDLSYPELEKKLDKEISDYVRHKYSHNGYCTCYTCGAIQPISSTDCGHYIVRAYRGARYDLKNLRPQCKRCNWTLEGNHQVFREKLVEEYGEAEVAKMEAYAKFFGQTRHPREWLISEIERYRELNKRIKERV